MRIAVPARSGGFLSGTYANRAGVRDYKLYIPESYDGQTLPLIVMLHGCKQSPDDFAAGTRMNAVAEQFPCFVVYPAQTPRANGMRCWNWFTATNQERGKGEPSIIVGITRHIIKNYPIDTRRVFVAGLSAGGAMAAILGETYPDLFAAVGVHSGLPYAVAHDLPSGMALMKQGVVLTRRWRHDGVHTPKRRRQLTPTIVFQGDSDRTVHPSNGDHLVAHWTMLHPQRTTLNDIRIDAHAVTHRDHARGGRAYTRTTYYDAHWRPVMEQWKIHGAGHAWSGGSPRGSYVDPSGPDASHEMMRFFLQHPRRRGRALLRWFRLFG